MSTLGMHCSFVLYWQFKSWWRLGARKRMALLNGDDELAAGRADLMMRNSKNNPA
jgi:hypothetical protein